MKLWILLFALGSTACTGFAELDEPCAEEGECLQGRCFGDGGCGIVAPGVCQEQGCPNGERCFLRACQMQCVNDCTVTGCEKSEVCNQQTLTCDLRSCLNPADEGCDELQCQSDGDCSTNRCIEGYCRPQPVGTCQLNEPPLRG